MLAPRLPVCRFFQSDDQRIAPLNCLVRRHIETQLPMNIATGAIRHPQVIPSALEK